jgi:hypothetical protein
MNVLRGENTPEDDRKAQAAGDSFDRLYDYNKQRAEEREAKGQAPYDQDAKTRKRQ